MLPVTTGSSSYGIDEIPFDTLSEFSLNKAQEPFPRSKNSRRLTSDKIDSCKSGVCKRRKIEEHLNEEETETFVKAVRNVLDSLGKTYADLLCSPKNRKIRSHVFQILSSDESLIALRAKIPFLGTDQAKTIRYWDERSSPLIKRVNHFNDSIPEIQNVLESLKHEVKNGTLKTAAADLRDRSFVLSGERFYFTRSDMRHYFKC